MDTAPWFGIFKDFGPFGLVIFVVVWIMRTLVPRFHETLQQQALATKDMMAKQEESGASIIKGILDELKTSRSEFSKALQDERIARSEDVLRLYNAIERGNRYLLYLISKGEKNGIVAPEILKILKDDVPKGSG